MLEQRLALDAAAGGDDAAWVRAAAYASKDAGVAPEFGSALRAATPDPFDSLSNYLPQRHSQYVPGGYLTGTSDRDPLQIALDYLAANATALGLTETMLQSAVVTDHYTSVPSGTTYVYLGQTVDGIPVANAVANVNISKVGRVISAFTNFVAPGAIAAGVSGLTLASAALTKADALFAASDWLQLKPSSGKELVPALSMATSGVWSTASSYAAPWLSQDPVPVRPTYVPTADGLELAWEMVVRTPDNNHWYNLSVSAATGKPLAASDWIRHATYNVFAAPAESPNDGTRTLLADPQLVAASPFGWHDTNGAVGAEFTDTRGNNVSAQEDADHDDTGGFRPDGTASLDFNFALDLSQAPSTYQSAAITNLFYWNNWIHDVTYMYGFDEAAGNFQTNNYSNGGAGGDAVQADAQDGSGMNNANFGTPPDGYAPRMQMYNWNLTSPQRDGDLDNQIIIHEYTHGISNRLTGGPADANALNAQQSGGMGEGWGDMLGLLLTQKVTDAKMDAYPLATYVLGQAPNGNGLRAYPYSFDMGIDPLTLGNYNSNQAVHFAGTIWCSVLWDLNWLLIDDYGFSSDLAAGYTGAGSSGNQLMLQLMLDGMKLQPANPTFLEARDAILQADQALTGGANYEAIWTAFARRGFGLSADVGADADSLAVTEAFDTPPFGLYVTASSPATGDVLAAPPTDFTVSFSHAYQASSVSAGDFAVNGIAADSVNLDDATHLTFHYNASPVTAQGLQAMDIAADTILRDSDGDGIDAFSANFRYDAVPMQVAATNPVAASTVTLPMASLEVSFNEPYLQSSVTASDLNVSQGTVSSVDYVDSDTVRFNLTGIDSEALLTATIAAGAITDAYGNPAFGNPASSYTANFTLDVATIAFPAPLDAKLPLGSLIYDPTVDAQIGTLGDTDSFTLQLDPDQTISLLVSPDAALAPVVEIRNPSNVVIGTASTAAGDEALLQTIPVGMAGTYKITVSGTGGTTGGYTLGVTLNAALESEAHGGPTNSTLATAQDLSSSFVALGNGVSRGAVRGAGELAAGYTAAAVGYQFTDISSTGTLVLPDVDDGTIELTDAALGDFHFSFYGATYSNAFVSSNGLIAFGSATGAYSNTDLTSSPPLATIAPFWDDLTTSSPAGAVYWQVLGSGANETLVVQWEDVNFLVNSGSNDHLTFQAILHEATGEIEFNYQDLTTGAPSIDEGKSASVGIKAAGTQGPDRLLLLYNNGPTALVATGKSVRLSPPPLPDDYYSFALSTGQSVTLAATGGGVHIELYDAANNLLAKGASAANLDAAISDYRPATGGTFYVRVLDTATDYSLVVTQAADFDMEANNAFTTAQSLQGDRAALGSLISAGDLNEYILDDGTQETSIGLNDGGDFMWINQFDDIGDSETITEVRAAWGGTLPDGTPVTISVYEDPNEDGDPTDAVFLTAVSTTSNANPGGDGFVTIAVPPTAVSGRFFVAARVPAQLANQFPAPIDESSDAGQSWAVGSASANGLDIYNLANNDAPPARLSDIGFPGNLLLRAGGQISDPEDWYTIAVTSGDILTIAATHPASGAGEFVNSLDAGIELYDPTGVLVASSLGVGVPSLTHAAMQSGEYRVRVVPESATNGEYVLTASGATGINPLPFVVSSNPGDGVTLAAYPTTYTVDLSEPILATSVDAGDLVVDGTAAIAVAQVDGDTLQFTLAAPGGPVEGTHNVVLAAGSVSDLQSDSNAAFNATFEVDLSGPRIVQTIWNGAAFPMDGVLPDGALTFQAVFDESLSGPPLTLDDVEVAESLTGQVFNATSLSYNETTFTVTAEFADLPEGNYTLTMYSGDDGFQDIVGNDLDGEATGANSDGTTTGDGVPGGNYGIGFDLDRVAPLAVTGFTRLNPLGGLGSQALANPGVLTNATDADQHTFFAEAGSTITAVVTPLAPVTVQADIAGILAPVASAAPGAPVYLGPITIPTTGTYILTSVADDPTLYTVDLYRNTTLEAIVGNSGDGNELPIDNSHVDLGSGRFAVLGTSTPTTATIYSADMTTDPDWTVTGAWAYGDPLGQAGDPNDGFSGTNVIGYNLAGAYANDMAAAEYATTPAFSTVGYQNIALSFKRWLGIEHANYDSAAIEASTDGTNWVSVWQHTGDTIDDDSWVDQSFDISAIAANAPTVYLRWSLGPTDDSVTYGGWNLDDVVVTATNTVPDGDEYLLDLSGHVGESIDVVLDGQGTADFSTNTTLELLAPDGTTVLATASNAPLGVDVTNYDLGVLGFQVPAAGTYTVRVTSHVSGDYGIVVTHGLAFDSEPNGALDPLRSLNDTGGALGYLAPSPLGDHYTVTLTAGQQVEVFTETPFDDATGDPPNDLDPALAIYAPGGSVLASDDNSLDGKNASTTFTASTAGIYTIEVTSLTNSTGEYVVKLQEVIDVTAPTVDIVDVTPDPRSTAVGSMNLVFSEAVTGLDLADLSLTRNGGSNLLTGSQTLSTSDNITWTLGNLSGLTTLAGSYQLGLTAAGSGIVDAASNPLVTGATDTFVVNATIPTGGRKVFYNRSAWDGGNSGADAGDDAAIASDKAALLPGQTGTFTNYTSYTRGINGVMVDIQGLPVASLAASDFQFKTGNTNNPASWISAPAPSNITVRPGAGVNGSDRVTLIWTDFSKALNPANEAVGNAWLQITVLANVNTGLAAPDVHYWGNQVGEVGNQPGNTAVNSAGDVALTLANRTGFIPAAITNLYDVNRDKAVNSAGDVALVNANRTGFSSLMLFAAPASFGAMLPSDGMPSEGMRPGAVAVGLSLQGQPDVGVISPSTGAISPRSVDSVFTQWGTKGGLVTTGGVPQTTYDRLFATDSRNYLQSGNSRNYDVTNEAENDELFELLARNRSA